MRKKKPKFQKFEIPDSFLEQLYELTGGSEKNKGYFLCHIDENGICQIKYKFDSQATLFAIDRTIEIYLNQQESDLLLNSGNVDFFEQDEEDD